MVKLAPSILSADFSRLGEQVREVSAAGADYIHIDVMDGHFVPNISFGPYVMKSLDKIETPPYDVHLMIENPEKFIGEFVTEKTEYIVVHQEACVHLHRVIQCIKALGVKAGVALNPATPVSALECILSDISLVLVMSVNPGFGGQGFIKDSLDKMRRLYRLREEMGYTYVIEADGGIGPGNVKQVVAAGCDLIVAGSAIFGAASPAGRVRAFKKII